MTEDRVAVRYAQSDDDVIAIHRFLCIVAAPGLPGPIDAQKSALEVWRVVNHDVALMAMRGDLMVGTMGLTCPDFWWGNLKFLANRWFFTIPGSRCGKALLKEAKAIGKASNMEVHIYSEGKGKILILNKSVKRKGFSHVLRQQPADLEQLDEQHHNDDASVVAH